MGEIIFPPAQILCEHPIRVCKTPKTLYLLGVSPFSICILNMAAIFGFAIGEVALFVLREHSKFVCEPISLCSCSKTLVDFFGTCKVSTLMMTIGAAFGIWSVTYSQQVGVVEKKRYRVGDRENFRRMPGRTLNSYVVWL